MDIFLLNDPMISQNNLQKLGGKAASLNRLAVAGLPVPPGFVLFERNAQLENKIAEIGGFPVAVRSSGSLEDLPNASFAGLYETILFVNSMEELNSAIDKCFASKDSLRVKDYLETKGITYTPESFTMSVLVQKMIDAKTAGVLFTLNPINGFEEECYIEWCDGVGERLVSGHVTPSTLRYNWIREEKVLEVINQELTTLSDHHLKELSDLAIKIQSFYGKPQDIEWAIGKDDSIYILQARPVTQYLPREDCPEVTNADLKDGGISARVCSPFMYSVYREALKISMGDYFKKIHLIQSDENIKWIFYHYGRVYWNAEAVKEGLKKLPDFNEKSFDEDLGIQKDYGSAGPEKTSLSLSSIVNAIPVLINLNREFLDCKNMVLLFKERFEETDRILKESLGQLKKLPEVGFNNWLLNVIRFQNETEKAYFRTIYNNSNYQTEYKKYLQKLSSYQDGDEIDLMSELQGVSHLDVQKGLAKLRTLSDFYGFDSQTYYRGREEFLSIHYHHGPAELDLTIPRWGEKKEWVDQLVMSYHPTTVQQVSNFQTTFARILKGLPYFKRNKFINNTNESRNFLRLREEMRTLSTRAYYLLRLGILEFGNRQGLSEAELFLLHINEIKYKLLRPLQSFPDTKKRNSLYQGYKNFIAPNEFGGNIKVRTSTYSSGNLKGLGCSPGVITGRARVILDIHKTGDLNKDEILVTAFTDPGWTPVLARVGGVVTEVGGLLSHAAVIGREYGIPAVLNLIDATKIIKDGDLIRVDGKSGAIEILEKGPDGKSKIGGN